MLINFCDLFLVFREVDGQEVEEEKLKAHSDWVRDVAWAPNVGIILLAS